MDVKKMLAVGAAVVGTVAMADVISSSVVGYNTDSLTGGKFYIKAAQFQDVQKGTATLNSIMAGYDGVNFDESFDFWTTAPQIQVQNATGTYDIFYFLNDA